MRFRTLFFLTFPLIIFSYFIRPVDSSEWIYNGKLFLNALLKADFKGTYLEVGVAQMHPGLSIEWISAIIHFLLPANLQYFLLPLHNLIFSSIFSICLILGLLIFSKSFSKKTIVVSATYIFLLPSFILAYGSTYLDWILSGFLFLSTAVWIEYLNNRKSSLIFWTGILIGISVLTKYVSVLIFPAFFILALIKEFSIKNIVKPLALIFLIAFVIFVIFYPAIWVNPAYVLFNLHGGKDSIYNFTLSVSNMIEIWKQLLRICLKLNPMIFIGSLLVLTSFTKAIKKEILLPAVAGYIYLICQIIAIQVIFYSKAGLLNYVNSIERYSILSTMLFTITVFEVIFQNKKLKTSHLLRNTLIVLLFLYEITTTASYIILTNMAF